jgi:preprotein translocase subunit SecD
VNRYPVWKYVVIALAMLFGLLYTLPNFFGESPAVQVSSGKATVKVDAPLLGRVEQILSAAQVPHTGVQLDGASIKVRLKDPDTQIKAKDALARALNPDAADPTYVVALNLLSSSPQWLTAMHALPMYLGLDLRGGVHFLLQVDMKAALAKRIDATVGELRSLLRDKNVRHAGIVRNGNAVEVRFRDEATAARARSLITDANADLALTDVPAEAGEFDIFENLFASRGVVLGVLIVLIAGVVLAVALGIFLPMWDMLKLMN